MTTNTSTRYATPGAVRNQNGGALPIRACKTCGDEIVWCKSAKTGKFYPVVVRYNHNDAAYYRGDDIHTCKPEVTLYGVVTKWNRCDLVTPCRTEAEMIDACHTFRRSAKHNDDDHNITEMIRMKITVREVDVWLSPAWMGASAWLANAEEIDREIFPKVAE